MKIILHTEREEEEEEEEEKNTDDERRKKIEEGSQSVGFQKKILLSVVLHK